MGQADVQAQLNRIASTKAELDRTIDDLFRAAPSKDDVVRQLALVAGMGVAAIAAAGVGLGSLRSRAERKAKAEDAQRHADALARALAKSPEELAPDDGSPLPWFVLGTALAAAGVAAWNARQG